MQRDSWSLAHLAREACRNVFHLRSKMFALLGCAVVIGTVIPIYAAIQGQQLRDLFAEEAALGRNVVLFSALDNTVPVSISRASCEALAHNADVDRAGMLRSQPTGDFVQLGSLVPVAEASTTLMPELASFGALVGHALRAPGPAFTLAMPDGNMHRAIVARRQPDAIGTNSDVVVALPVQVTSASSCLAVLTPTAREAEVAPRLLAALQATGGNLSAQQQFSEPRNPITVYLARPEQYLPLLLALAGGLAAGTVNRLRSGEWAAYRMSGTAPRSVGVVMLLEQVALAGCLAFSSAATTLMVAPRLLSPISTHGWAVAAAALWVIAATVASAGIALKKPTNLAKDR